MAETVVALFKTPAAAEGAVKEIEKLGIPKREVNLLTEPFIFSVESVMSFTRLDFEVELRYALGQIGATKLEQEAYIQGLRNGGALVLASGPNATVKAAADIMNRRGAMDLEKGGAREPDLPEPNFEAAPSRDTPVQAGRVRESGSGAHLFVW